MRVTVGPVEPASAHAWIGWAREMLGALRREPGATLTLPTQVVEDVGSYVESWAGAAHDGGESFRWNVDVDPDELEYLTNCLYNLDVWLADQASPWPGRLEPAEGRAFHAVLVEGLLYALAQAGPSQAEFAEQLRPCWPVRHLDRPTAAASTPAAATRSWPAAPTGGLGSQS